MTNKPIDQLSRALEATELVIAAVRPEQWEGRTPCAGWTVRDVVSHLVSGNRAFTAVLCGPPAAASGESLPPDAELWGAYRDSASALVAAFSQPGALERVCTVAVGAVPGIVALNLRITEALVHGWDLARATGQPSSFPEDLAEQELTFTRSKLAELPPDHYPFDLPQPVADEAPAIDRLAACLGRNVTTEAFPDAAHPFQP